MLIGYFCCCISYAEIKKLIDTTDLGSLDCVMSYISTNFDTVGIKKNCDNGNFCVVYGSQHTRMPSISALRIGDIVYPVSIKDGTLCAMARLPIDKNEPAYDYLIRET